MASHKRPRTPPLYSTEPAPKFSRTVPLSPSDDSTATVTTSAGRPLFCTLPPTCNPPHRPTPLANSKDLEVHYAKYHAHVCEERGCGCVFPEERLLELHQTECHDPIASVRKDRGEKIFACHLTTCPRLFQTPKARRLHLIQAHGYPKEYFFAVTNKGVGGLLKRWGEGASMIRGAWKSRDIGEVEEKDEGDEGDDDEGDDGIEISDVQTDNNAKTGPRLVIEESYEEEDDDNDGDDGEGSTASDSDSSTPAPTTIGDKGKASLGDNVDVLANSMEALSLVPSSIQFGRGAKRGGSHGNAGARARRGNPRLRTGSGQGQIPAMEVDIANGGGGSDTSYTRGGRGRGRGKPRGARGGAAPHWEPPRERDPVQGTNPARGLGGSRRSGFPGPGRGRPIGRAVAIRRGMAAGRGL